MRFFRTTHLVVLFLLSLALLLVIPASFAQGQTFGLSESDFQLFSNFDVPESFRYDATFSLVADAEGDSVNANLTANGLFDANNEAFQLILGGSVTDDTGTTPLTAEVRITGGSIYFNVVDPDTGEASGWLGTPLDDALSSVEDLAGAFGGGDLGAFGGGDLGSTDELLGSLEALGNVDPSAFINMSRLGDESIGGVSAAHFNVNFDVAAFFGSPAFGAIMDIVGSTGALDDIGLPPAQLQAMGALLGVFLQDVVLEFDTFVSPQDNMLRGLDFVFDLNLDPAALTGEPGSPIVIGFDLGLRMTDVNQSLTVEAPADAVVFQGNALDQILGGDFGGGDVAVPVPPDSSNLVPGVPVVANVPSIVNLTGTGAVPVTYVSPGNETVTIILRGGPVDTVLTVNDPSGFELDRNDDHGTTRADLGSFDSALVDLSLSAPGSYTILVDSFSGTSSGAIEVVVESAGGGAAPPKSGASSETVSGTVAANSTYTQTVSLNQGDVVTIRVRGTSTGFDPRAALVDPAGVSVASNDDHGTNDSALSTFDSKIEDFVAGSGGAFTLQVTEFSGAAGTFDVIIDIGSGGGGGSSAGGTQVFTGSLAANGSFVQQVSLTAGNVVTITVRDTSGTLDPRVELLDPNGSQVAVNDDHGTSDATLDTFDSKIENQSISATGLHTLSVTDFFGATGNFEMTVEVR